ncbi:MAG: glycosyl transferase [Bacteroidetes bacterium]|nr:glycosyl transferase [Bacteroidota bacterium]MDA1120305.1 glycosyl transferase [Bacteroidota bacterium]
MKILYAIQGTGNGHLSRAKDVIPALMKRAHIDILISGIQADIELPFYVKYRYRGISFIFGKKGGVDILSTYRFCKTREVWNEIRKCPVQNYDLVINDFEPISAWACKLRDVKCIGLSHQGSLRSKKVPIPSHNDPIGWFVLKDYAPCNSYYSFHFKKYDDNIFTPIIRQEIRNQEITDEKHYTVYLPSYGDGKLLRVLSQIKKVRWEVFSKYADKTYNVENVIISPINSESFSRSMASSAGVLCGAGFETPAEALYLGKKLLVIPMKSQFEQHFNAEGLKEMGVPVIKKLSKKNIKNILKWVDADHHIPVYFPNETQFIVDKVLEEQLLPLIERIPAEKPLFPFLNLKTNN